jgi:fused signal recognition particle receptor
MVPAALDPEHTAHNYRTVMGIFDKLKQGLSKTWKSLNTDVRDLFKSEGRLVDDVFLDELRAMLFKTDMGYDATEQIVAQIATEFRARVVTWKQVLDVIKKKLRELMAQDDAPIRFAESGPTVVMVCGVNGSGKTTTIAKLARLFQSQGKKVVLGAGDTFRAAAVEQLTIWSDRIGVPIVKGEPGSHPASVAYRAVEEAIKTKADVAIIDTAGRLQTQKNLMAELTKIRRRSANRFRRRRTK